VGYCTLYGDMVGGLAVISDVPKTLVYRLSHCVNSRRPVIPQSTLEKPPSAELRADQKDSDSLPPYEILDAVLEDYVEDAHSVERIAADHGFDTEIVRRVVRMVDRAEYKRQQDFSQSFRFRPPISHRGEERGLKISIRQAAVPASKIFSEKLKSKGNPCALFLGRFLFWC
jgi:NAD+ synthetase